MPTNMHVDMSAVAAGFQGLGEDPGGHGWDFPGYVFSA